MSTDDFLKKIKRQYINFSLIHAASLGQYLRHFFFFCLFYGRKEGAASFPLNITLDLIYDCNLNCDFCFVSSETRGDLSGGNSPLSYQENERFITSLKGKNTTFLLTGGEPTLRKDFVNIVKCIKGNKFKCGVFTNATHLMPDTSDDLLRYQLDYLMFSLDGPKDIHDALRGQGVFEKVRHNIAYILKKRKNQSPRVIMSSVVLPENYKKLKEIVDIADQWNVDGIAFDFLAFLTEKEADRHKKFFGETFSHSELRSLICVKDFSDKDTKGLPGVIKDLRAYTKKKKVRIFFKPDLGNKELEEWFNSDFRFYRSCIYPWNVLRISPYGDVYPCAQFYIKMGNIRNAPIEKIWNNEEFCNFRRILKKQRMFPGCNRCCKL